mgnify:CR=1 FL=1
MQHYFNPSYAMDLRNRLEKGIKSLFLMIAPATPVTSEK